MKAFLFILTCIAILSSCRDSTEPTKKESNYVIVIDSASNKPISECYVKFDYMFESSDDYSINDFSLAPNPTNNIVKFYFELKESGDYSIEILNQVDSTTFTLMHQNFDDLGYHSYIINLNDSTSINNGFYTAYLKHSNEVIDSISLAYFSDFHQILFNDTYNQYTLYAIHKQTDNQGKATVDPALFKFFNKSFIRVGENGSIFGKLNVSQITLLSIYDSTGCIKLYEKVVPFEKFKEGYTIFVQ